MRNQGDAAIDAPVRATSFSSNRATCPRIPVWRGSPASAADEAGRACDQRLAAGHLVVAGMAGQLSQHGSASAHAFPSMHVSHWLALC